jgi:hypothetical protein
LESFPEEPAQVQLQLLTATVKLFLKKPTEGPQQMIQVLVLCLLTCSLYLIQSGSLFHIHLTFHCPLEFSVLCLAPLT